MVITRLSRRQFLLAGTAVSVSAALPGPAILSVAPSAATLSPAADTVKLMAPEGPVTEIWAYNGRVPGPVLRARQGDALRVELVNRLDEPTTVHWARPAYRQRHGRRAVPDPGSGRGRRPFRLRISAHRCRNLLWYHPHANTSVQVGRGLSGPLIVEETDPPAVDRDVVWLLDDWRLQEDAAIAPFGMLHDAAHAGCLGNVATINGRDPEPLAVTAGERLRLRLINAANARVFALLFKGHAPWVVAVDGHPVKPRRLAAGRAVVAPGMRLDLIVDMTGQPGDSFDVIDIAYQRQTYRLTQIAYADASPLHRERLPPEVLTPNPVALSEPKAAVDHEMVFQGGAMGGMQSAIYRGETKSLRDLAASGMVWAVNGTVLPSMEEDDPGEPLLDLKLGRTYRLRWTNDTAFDHPIHLHGHTFRVDARDGNDVEELDLRDTVLIAPGRSVDGAFVADNPGDWALHCHVLEHARAGMMGYVRVS